MGLSVIKKEIRKNRKLCIYQTEFDPRKKTLVFIHGLGGHARDWHCQWRHYEKNYNIIACDLFGFGQSDQSKLKYDYSVFKYLLDFRQLLEMEKYQHIIVFGYGFGAIIALHLALLFPNKIKKLILLNPIVLQYDHIFKSKFWRYLPTAIIKIFIHFGLWRNLWQRRFSKGHPHDIRSIKYALQMLYYLPEISYENIAQNTLLLLSKDHHLVDTNKIANYYKERLKKLKIKSISSKHYTLMENENQLNYYSDEFIEHLNISAFRNLVFEGAGVRGIAYSGAVSSLEKLGVMKNIKRVCGVSSGAIYATLVALNYSAKELYEVVSNVDYRQFTDTGRNFILNSTRFLSDFGWYRGQRFYDWISERISDKTGDETLTFRKLRHLKGRDLYIVATNMSKGCADVFSFDTVPDMQIRDAVRMSMSIPMYYHAIKRQCNEGECVMIDGGMSWNYPIHLFDDEKYIENPLNIGNIKYPGLSKSYCFNHETLGFRLEPLFELPNQEQEKKPYTKVSNIVEYAKILMQFIAEVSVKGHLPKDDWNRTVFVDTLGVAATDFNIDQASIDAIIEQGKLGVQKHFAWRMSRDGIRFPQ